MINNELLKIKQEYQDSVPALTAEEYKSLKESIESQGQYHPITVNRDLVILDGHHRHKICNELGREPKYIIKDDFPSKLHEELFVMESNLHGRERTPFVRAMIALKCKPILEKIARQRMLSGKKINPTQIFVEGSGEVNEQVGQRARLSRETMRKVEFIEIYATEEVK